jgi:SAM-dependent methyltransferase
LADDRGPQGATHRYDSEYLDALEARWTTASFPMISSIVATTLAAHRPRRILDYGAGAGAYAGVLSSLGAEVHACDVSAEAAAACEGRYMRVFLIDDSSDLGSDEYDMVFSTEVLEHIRDYRLSLRRLYRALRPGGVLLLTTTAYSPSLFTMIGQARASRMSFSRLLGATATWLVGFGSEKQRDAFIERWCFTSLGGHHHGFTRHGLNKAVIDSGFSLSQCRNLYVLEPLQLSFLSAPSAGNLLKRMDWPKGKRLIAAAVFLAAAPLNCLLKRGGLLANNLYLVAVKTGAERSVALEDFERPQEHVTTTRATLTPSTVRCPPTPHPVGWTDFTRGGAARKERA